MKQILFSLLLVASGVITKAQTVDEIVAKHIEAVGGVDAWKKVNSIRMEGTVMVQGADVSVIVTSVNKKGARQDISLMGMNGFVIITPTAGWTYLPFQGQNEVDAMTEDDLKETVDELDIEGKLIGYKEKGTTIDYLGKEDVDGTECDKLAVTTKSGNKETCFIDPASSHIIKSIKAQNSKWTRSRRSNNV